VASDVQDKSGPLPKPLKLTKQGVRDLGRPKGTKQKKVYTYWWMGAKHDSLWNACRAAWFDLNPPDHQGYYQCALCPQMVLKTETTLDHIITRSRDPKLKYVLENLQPAHYVCNNQRGSMSMEAWNAQRKD
jgi:5-methylcytosine-specific restriction endonuclease McrA